MSPITSLSPLSLFLLAFLFIPTLFSLFSSVTSSSSSSSSSSASEKPPRLLFVAELCRHGDRTPLGSSPADALPVSKWPEGLGELTAIGQRAHYELGQRLRSRYVDTGFLSPSYSVREIYVRSSDVDRTLVSAHSQLMGLYPPGTATNDDVRVKFGFDAPSDEHIGLPHRIQPIPIHTIPKSIDGLLLPGANCQRHDVIMHQKRTSDIFKQKLEMEKPFLKTVATLVQEKNVDDFGLYDLERVSDTWTCFQAHNVPLPSGTTKAIVEHAKNISNWLLAFGNSGDEVHRLRAGLLLNTVREYMAMAKLREQNRLPIELESKAKKFLLLSAHDTTVAATLAAMRVYKDDLFYPPYNSTIFWELWKRDSVDNDNDDNNLFIRVEFNGQPLQLDGCTSVNCSISEYLASTRDVTIFGGEDEREKECTVGLQRYAAMFTNVFKSKSYQFDSISSLHHPTTTSTSSSSSSASSSWLFIPNSFLTVTALIVALVAGFMAWRAHARYNGYVLQQQSSNEVDGERLGDDKLPLTRDQFTTQRILM